MKASVHCTSSSSQQLKMAQNGIATTSENAYHAAVFELVDKIVAMDLQYSTTGAPGGGGHNAYKFGCPAVEQQAAQSCINRVLAHLSTQTLPTANPLYHQYLTNLKTFLMTLKMEMGEYFINDVNTGLTNHTNHFVGPPAFDAMRLKVLAEVQRRLIRQLAL
jgi:hypothetical protein